MKQKAQQLIDKTIPDPRNDPMQQRPVGYEDFKSYGAKLSGEKVGQQNLKEGETLEDYIAKRNKEWAERNILVGSEAAKAQGLRLREDGSILFPGGDTRESYGSLEAHSSFMQEQKAAADKIDEEKVKLRRQLQVENEAEYRRFVAEQKRQEIQEQQQLKRRMPHPADPKYDPFKNFPGYRPQDSAKLATWLKTQRESGKAVSGQSLGTKEGQERFYNEEKMATQYNANPFASRVEYPRGRSRFEITAYSPDSLFVNDREIIGSCIVTPTRYFHWNVTNFEDVNLKTLSLLLHWYPVPEVVFLGTGRNQHFVSEEIRLAFLKRGTILHCLTTRDATSNFGLQMSNKRRVCCACIMNIPTNGFGRECFGDFVENDSFSLSDSALGIWPTRQFNPMLYYSNPIAEKYRHMVGTGFGPKYGVTSDGRLVRPGTAGTKLRPMLEPGEEEQVEWEKLPSYYHWFPKEKAEDYLENTTWRELKGKAWKERAETKVKSIVHGDLPRERERWSNPEPPMMPWDSNTIPLMKWPHEKFEDITVDDTATGRLVSMEHGTYEKFKQMMADRKAGREPTVEVEFDQERFVSDKTGKLYDMSQTRFVPLHEGKFHLYRRGQYKNNNPLPK